MKKFSVWILTLIFVAAFPMMAKAMKLYAPLEPVGVQVAPHNLRGQGVAFSELQKLYDRDESTVFVAEKPCEITLDLGGLFILGGVRFLPAEGEKEQDIDRCQGTVFSVSNNNRVFQRAAIAEPLDTIGYTPEWKEFSFGGVGQLRYGRISIPAGARIAEVEWLAYPGWSFQRARRGQTRWDMLLYAYDVERELESKLIATAYNDQGVLKAISVVDKSFSKGEERMESVSLSIPNHKVGDSYRLLAWDKDGTSLIAQDLHYAYTQGSPAFSMPNLFSDHMMLQADKPLTIWGDAPPNAVVELSLSNGKDQPVLIQTIADRDARWTAELGHFAHGGDYTLTVRCGAKEKVFEHITFGDIWLCIGQSNMVYHMLGGKDTQKYLRSKQGKAETNNPQIRLLNLWCKGAGGAGAPVEHLPVGYVHPAWTMMNPDAASYCSAIGYFFATEIQQQFQIPIGIITAAVGDTEINRWVPYDMILGSFTSTDGGLYYNRIMPLSKLQIRGILMYQGEADEYRTHLSTATYRDAMGGLVDLYRGIWGEDLPFYWAQLTRYKKDESLVREGQRLALSVIANPENAGVISLMDIYGERKSGVGNCREDIHPHQKQLAAERFARLAKRDVYGGAGIGETGPAYQSAQRIENQLELTFLSTGDLCVLPKEQYADRQGMQWILEKEMDETRPQEFEVAGKDGIFYPAKAEIHGNTIRVWNEKVDTPVMARYAWGAYPEMPNLTDQSGLPALSFCTEWVN